MHVYLKPDHRAVVGSHHVTIVLYAYSLQLNWQLKYHYRYYNKIVQIRPHTIVLKLSDTVYTHAWCRHLMHHNNNIIIICPV